MFRNRQDVGVFGPKRVQFWGRTTTCVHVLPLLRGHKGGTSTSLMNFSGHKKRTFFFSSLLGNNTGKQIL